MGGVGRAVFGSVGKVRSLGTIGVSRSPVSGFRLGDSLMTVPDVSDVTLRVSQNSLHVLRVEKV